MSSNRKQIKYAYVVTVLGVALALVTTAYNAIRSYLFSQRRMHPFPDSGNFTNHQFGNFTGPPRQFGYINPYGGFVGALSLIAVIVAIVGVLWLGMTLRNLNAKTS